MASECEADEPHGVPMQDPTGEAATEVQKHLTLYELDLGVNNVVRPECGDAQPGLQIIDRTMIKTV